MILDKVTHLFIYFRLYDSIPVLYEWFASASDNFDVDFKNTRLTEDICNETSPCNRKYSNRGVTIEFQITSPRQFYNKYAC